MDAVILIGIGMLLLGAEVFIPGGIAGLLGFSCLIGAVVVGYVDYGAEIGTSILAGVFLVLIIGIALWAKYFHLTPIAKALTDVGVIGGASIDDRTDALMGKEGTAVSNLRPCGLAKIGGARVDVVSETGMIEKGAKILVVQVEGIRVVVRQVTEELSPKDQTKIESTS